MGDITTLLVSRQIEAFGARQYEIGLIRQSLPGEKVEVDRRTYSARQLVGRICWLKLMNAAGWSVNICPAAPDNRFLVVDDISLETVARMQTEGFEPCVVVETSPNNHQAWLQYPESFPSQELATRLAKDLAKRFSSDFGSASGRHMGKLAGFTNRKPVHLNLRSGLYPYVKLIASVGGVFTKATEQVATVQKELEIEHAQMRAAQYVKSETSRKVKTIEDFRGDARYNGDGHVIDAAYACYALSRGISDVEIAAAIATRDLRKKGSPAQQNAWIQSTIRAARRRVQLG